jgi:photosystem II stability/assembly factor-like uncharacterized protein
MRFVVLICFAFVASVCFGQTNVKLNSYMFGAIEARDIGPATMSGRIAAIDAVKNDPRIIYVGAASGGVWKSKNGGVTFKAIFDKHTQSIGALTIDQNHPDTVWVGTGETWIRNSVSIGEGIFKTVNGGEKWQCMGLEKTERIAKIIIHPQNPDIIYVAALGHLWDANVERGVYKTSDGGESWQKVLYVDQNTGCSDLAMDPGDPNILYAAMWEFRRKPYTFKSGGPGSGLYKSMDGGGSWDKVTKGLPQTELGRIAVAVSPLKAELLYALIESEKTALYRSLDKGQSWERMNTSQMVAERPFYFSLIVPDPQEVDRVYKPGMRSLWVSVDQGHAFSSAFVEGGNVHSDLHALWIDPNNNKNMYLGTDGGVYVSNDRGSTFRLIQNLPLSQFYHVSVDLETPYNVYGGLQDNGSWIGPSASPGGIENGDWENVGYGDGFYVFPDQTDDNILYWQYQGGMVMRLYKNTRETKEIRPFAEKATEKLRFNWNTPIYFSPSAAGIMYIGAQYLYRSKDKGDTWEKISPDLTTNDPQKQRQEESGGLTIDNSTAENHCTIYTICESPLDSKIIWAGTDDGNLQVSRDGGKSWQNVVKNIKYLPPNTWCSNVYCSHKNSETAYVTFDGHRSGDMTPYVFRTSDLGKTWISLATDDIKGVTHVIREDFVNPNLLFLGTEMGLFVSIDDGKQWVQFTGNMPNVSVRDMVIHPRESDLVLATHGRGIMIIDDITPLRHLTPELLQSDVAILPSRPFIITNPKYSQSFSGDQEFVGRNPSGAAFITYYMKKRHVFGDMYLEIHDAQGNKLKTLPGGKRKGINRVRWYVRKKPPKVRATNPMLAFRTAFGPTYPPGEYTVKIVKNSQTYSSEVKLASDPISTHSPEEKELQFKTLTKAYDMLEELSFLDRKVTDIRDKARAMANKVMDANLKKNLVTLSDNMENIHKELLATSPDMLSGESKLAEKIGDIYSAVINYQGQPTASQIQRLDELQKELFRQKQGVEKIIKADLTKINNTLEKSGLKTIKVITKEEFEQTD